MATVVVNRCKMTVTGTPGASGNITLSAASSGFQTLANALSERSLADGVTLSYVIEEGTSWQECTGVSSASSLTLSRTNGWSSAGNTTGIAFTSAATVMFIAAASDMGMKANVQTFNSSGTWTKPSGMGANAMALIEAWGGGGSGAKYSGGVSAGGGGGGGYNSRWVLMSSLGSTETVTIGAGGAADIFANTDGNGGGTSSFGAWLAAYGGGGGTRAAGGGGGGGPMGAASLQTPGAPLISVGYDATNSVENYQGGVNFDLSSNSGWFHGGAGGINAAAGAVSQYGGGGGGGYNSGAGGTSVAGGAGGGGSPSSAASAGTQPGGGGGATSVGTSGAGGAGRIRITIIDGN